MVSKHSGFEALGNISGAVHITASAALVMHNIRAGSVTAVNGATGTLYAASSATVVGGIITAIS